MRTRRRGIAGGLVALLVVATTLGPGCASRRMQWAHERTMRVAELPGMAAGFLTYPATLVLLPFTAPLTAGGVPGPLGKVNGTSPEETWVVYPTFILGVGVAYLIVSPLLPFFFAVAPPDRRRDRDRSDPVSLPRPSVE